MARGKKTGGRQKGSLNKVTREIRDVSRQMLERPEYLRALQARLDAGTAGPVESLLYHYGYGKPKETIEHSTPMRPVVVDLLQSGEGLKVDGADD